MFCVYLTIYFGNKLPRRYIGSSSIKKVINGYNGSVASKKYKQIYDDEQKNNKHLFKTRILSIFNTDKDARIEEYRLQRKYNVVKSNDYFNESFARINGFFGRDVSGELNPMAGTSRKGEKHKGGENISAGIKKFFESEKGKEEKRLRSIRFSGENNGMYGKKHTDEWKKNRSINMSGENHYTAKGETPSLKNKRLYNNGIKTIALGEYDSIPDGFVLGRHKSSPYKGVRLTEENKKKNKENGNYNKNNGMGVPKLRNIYLIDNQLITDLEKFCKENDYVKTTFIKKLKDSNKVYNHEVIILKGRNGRNGSFEHELYKKYETEINLFYVNSIAHG